MENVCGSVTINFVARVSKKKLKDDFGMGLFKDGHISLVNIDNEVVEMEVLEYDYGVLDDEDD